MGAGESAQREEVPYPAEPAPRLRPDPQQRRRRARRAADEPGAQESGAAPGGPDLLQPSAPPQPAPDPAPDRPNGQRPHAPPQPARDPGRALEARAALVRRHRHYIDAFTQLRVQRMPLQEGMRVRHVPASGEHFPPGSRRGEAVGPTGDQVRGCPVWTVEMRGEGRRDCLALPRDRLVIDDRRVMEQVTADVERRLIAALHDHFRPPGRPRAFTPGARDRSCPYPDGCRETRSWHKHGVSATGCFHVNPRLDTTDVPTIFQPGITLAVTARYSNMLHEDDAAMDCRGLALSFAAPGDASPLDLMGLTGAASPWWSASSMTDFVSAVHEGGSALEQWLELHPWSFRAYVGALKRAPRSYAALRYYTHDLYEARSPDGRDFRCRFCFCPEGSTPSGPEPELLPEEDCRGPWHAARLRREERPKDYLRAGLTEQLRRAPVSAALYAQVLPHHPAWDAAHRNAALPPPEGAAGAEWVRVGELRLIAPLDADPGDARVYSVSHHTAGLRPAEARSAGDLGSALVLRARAFPAACAPPPPKPLVRYRVRILVGQSQPRREFCDEAAVTVTMLGRTAATEPLLLPRWSGNTFRQLSADQWVVYSETHVPDLAALRLSLEPWGKHAAWYLKRVEVAVEQGGNRAVVRDAGAVQRALSACGLPGDAAARAGQECEAVGGRDSDTLVHVQFDQEPDPVPFPAAALAPADCAFSFPAYRWLRGGELLLFAAGDWDGAAAGPAREALDAYMRRRRRELQWAAPAPEQERSGLLPLGLRAGQAEADAEADAADCCGALPEALGCAAGRLAAALAYEAAALGLSGDAEMQCEDRLHVDAPSADLDVSGVYRLRAGETREGLPLWEREGDPDPCRWLCSLAGRWALCAAPAPPEPPAPGAPSAPAPAALFCHCPHQGRRPAADWRHHRRQGAGPSWGTAAGRDPSIVVEPHAEWEAAGGAAELRAAMHAALLSSPELSRPAPPAAAPDGDSELEWLFASSTLSLCLEDFAGWHAALTARGEEARFRITDEDVEPLLPTRAMDSVVSSLERGCELIHSVARRGRLVVADLAVTAGLQLREGCALGSPVLLFLREPREGGGGVGLSLLALQPSVHSVRACTRAACSPDDWAAAKAAAMSAAAHVVFFGQLCLHTRCVPECFAATLQRELPPPHPLLRLLLPHCRGAAPAAAEARRMAEQGSPVLEAFAVTAAGARELQGRLFARWGLDRCNAAPLRPHLQGLPFPEQAAAVYGELRHYALAQVRDCYPDAEAQGGVSDPALQSWLAELAAALRAPRWQCLFAAGRAAAPAVDDVADICVAFIWSVSALAAAVERTVWEAFALPAAGPLSVRRAAEWRRGELPAGGGCGDTAARLRELLPNRQRGALQVALASLVGRRPCCPAPEELALDVLFQPEQGPGEVLPLGWWTEDYLVSAPLKANVRALQERLRELALSFRALGDSLVCPASAPNHLIPIGDR